MHHITLGRHKNTFPVSQSKLWRRGRETKIPLILDILLSEWRKHNQGLIEDEYYTDTHKKL